MPLRFLPDVHRLYFDDNEQGDKFEARSMWALHNAFTQAVKSLRVMPQQHAGVSIGATLVGRFARSSTVPATSL